MCCIAGTKLGPGDFPDCASCGSPIDWVIDMVRCSGCKEMYHKACVNQPQLAGNYVMHSCVGCRNPGTVGGILDELMATFHQSSLAKGTHTGYRTRFNTVQRVLTTMLGVTFWHVLPMDGKVDRMLVLGYLQLRKLEKATRKSVVRELGLWD